MSSEPLCVECRVRPVAARWKPFCSERCKMVDLGRWLGGQYRIPGEPAEPADGERDGRSAKRVDPESEGDPE